MNASSTLMIRAAGPEDFAAVSYLLEELDWLHIDWYPEYFQPSNNRQPRPESLLREYTEHKDGDILLAIDQAGLVGLIMVKVRRPPNLPTLKSAPWVQVDSLIVEAQQRGNGIGKALMEAAKNWAEERDIFEVQLQVYEANHSAREFYEQQGFTPLSQMFRLRW